MSGNPASDRPRRLLLFAAIAGLAVAGPLLFPEYRTQMAFLWVMVVFALTWDVVGGQMGYNSFGNVVFFGVGMYVCAVIQRDAGLGYYGGLAIGIAAGGAAAVALAAVVGAGLLGLRGHYFAIGTLGLAIAAGEIAASWDFIGAGSGLVTPVYPGNIEHRTLFFYALCLLVTIATFFTLRWIYSGRFGLALNAIRDDEDKAEALGIRTTRFKTVAWSISAVFLGMIGAIVGNMIGFIDPRDVAFAGATYGVWMVLMAILGGKGTLWGPVIGAVLFHVTQELFWTYLFGWQRVALGALIVLIVIFFPQGILGWLRERWPERFGHRVENPAAAASEGSAG